MRPYRGLTKEGKWVYGDKIEFDCLCYILPKGRAIILSSKVAVSGKDCGASVCGFIQVIPETVGQFVTKDKNGKDVYAGDTVKAENWYFEVIWQKYGFGLKGKKSGWWRQFHEFEDIELIEDKEDE